MTELRDLRNSEVWNTMYSTELVGKIVQKALTTRGNNIQSTGYQLVYFAKFGEKCAEALILCQRIKKS